MGEAGNPKLLGEVEQEELFESESDDEELSSHSEQLPIKRSSGLSRYYQGKSQSFTSLSSVTRIEDLPKKENPFNYRRKMKPCKSCAGMRLPPSAASCASSLVSEQRACLEELRSGK